MVDAPAQWTLRIYIAGKSPKSMTALANLRSICETELAPGYEIEIVDLQERPELARQHQIVAIPTVVRVLPDPIRKVIGDLSKRERVLVGLDLLPRTGTSG